MNLHKLALVFSFLNIFSIGSKAQITVEGIEGLIFQNADSSYTKEITDTFHLHGMKVSPQSLTLSWTPSESKFTLYGNAVLTVHENNIAVVFGNIESPGLVIEHGSITSADLSVQGSFKMYKMDFTSESLEIKWSKAGNVYAFFGRGIAVFDSNSVEVSFGDSAEVGVVINNGSIVQFSLGVTAEFDLYGVKFNPDNLTLFHNFDDESYRIYGELNASVQEQIIKLNAGTSGAPGIKIVNGSLNFLRLSVTADFSLSGLKLSPSNLTFEYDKTDNLYKIYGAVEINIDDEKFDVILGESSNPGLLIENGKLSSFNTSIYGNFKMGGLDFVSDSLTFQYNKTNNSYIIFGKDIIAIAGADSIFVYAGTKEEPGIEIIDGRLGGFNLGITADFKLNSLEIAPRKLTIKYNTNEHYVSMMGAAKLKIESDSIVVDFGSEEEPGVQIKNGTLTHLSLSITGDFKLKNLEFNPVDLTFGYDKDSSKYFIYGKLKVKIENDSIDASFGSKTNPGFVYKEGLIKDINISLTGEFGIKDIIVEPRGLSFEYHNASSAYLIYGNCNVKIETDSINSSLGSRSSPGIKIVNGKLEHIHIGITGHFSLKGLSFIPKNLTFEWDKANNYFEMYGAADIILEEDSISVSLGDSTNPGAIIQNKKLKSVNVRVSADFKLKGLTIEVRDVTIIYNSNKYEFYGDIKLNFEGESVEANFGNAENPGLLVVDGKITHFYIGITGNIKLGSLTASAYNLACEYEGDKKRYYLSGKIKLEAVYSLEVDLGKNGIEIDASGAHNKLIINGVILELDHANLGTIDFKKIRISFDHNGIKEADLNVAFPMGWEVEADMTFTGSPAKIHQVTIDWQATNIAKAIQIPGTGVAVIEIKGSMNNIDNPSNLIFVGNVVLAYGGPEKIDGKETAFFVMGTEVTITKSELKFHTDVELGAYKDGSKWKGLLGSGKATLDLKWNKAYTFDADIKIPSDPLVKIDANFKLNKSKDIKALMEVGFIVPKWIPFVGGKKFGSVDGALKSIHGNPGSSYAAGWVHYKIKVLFVHKSGDIGAKYNFGSRKVSKIGSDDIKHIKKDIQNLSKQNYAGKNFKMSDYNEIVSSFKIEDDLSPDMLMLHLNWGSDVDTAYIVVCGPDGIYELTKLNLIEESADTANIDSLRFNVVENFSMVESDSSVSFVLFSPGAKGSVGKKSATITPGEYQLFFAYNSSKNNIDSLNLTVDAYYPEASGGLSVQKPAHGSYDLALDYWVHRTDSIDVSFYWNDTTSYNGHKIANMPAITMTGTGLMNAFVRTSPENIKNGKKIYFYAIIDDGINKPYYTDFSEEFIHTNPLSGRTLLIENGELSPMEGITVYLDKLKNQKFDTESTGGLDYAVITDENGHFSFNSSLDSSNDVNIVIPYGYELDESSPNELSYYYDSNENPIELLFIFKKKDASQNAKNY